MPLTIHALVLLLCATICLATPIDEASVVYDSAFHRETIFSRIAALKRQPDGRIIVGTSGGPVIRLNSDGTQESTFENHGTVLEICIQEDGKILLGGELSHNLQYTPVIRLNPDGSVDSSYHLMLQPSGQQRPDWF